MVTRFCGLDPAEPVFDATAFTHNRSRLDEYGITAAFFDAVRTRAVDARLTSDTRRCPRDRLAARVAWVAGRRKTGR